MQITVEDIIKIIGIGLMALVMVVIIKQYRPEFAIYISLLTGIIILLFSLDKLTGIINLIKTISESSGINNKYILILLKITGITILTELAVNVCKDSGESAIAGKIEIGSKVMIISLSIPIISSLLELIVKILP